MEDKDLIGICLKELADKMGYRDFSRLSQRDYEHLCSQVEKETGISLSLSTIKRIFSGNYKRLPQTYTLDALTRFTGYEGWQDFKLKQQKRKLPEPAGEPEKVSDKRSILLYPVAGAVFLLLLILLFKMYPGKPQNEPGRDEVLTAGVEFNARKSLAEGVPNSVIFSYNIDNAEADSFFIQTSWDPEKKTPVQKNHYTFTTLYYEPGLHTARLIADGKVLKEAEVYIPVNNWIAFTRINWNDPPVYFKDLAPHDQVFGLTETDLLENRVTASKERFFVYSWFPSSLSLNSDNFKLKTRVRLQSVQNAPCPGIHTTIFCSSGWMYITNTNPGCISLLSAQFSEKYLSGETTDLSSFGYDMTTWHTIEIHVKQKRVQVYIEGNKVLEQDYKEPAGMIKGLTYRSNGLCEIDFTELRDSQDSVVYREDFGEKPAFSAALSSQALPLS